MLELSTKMDLPMERIDACNGEDAVREHPEWVILMMNDLYYRTLSAQIRCNACTMSHYKALERGLESGAQVVLILEDDTCFAPNLDQCCDAFEQAMKDLT